MTTNYQTTASVATQDEQDLSVALRVNVENWIDLDQQIIWVHGLPNASLSAERIKQAFEEKQLPDGSDLRRIGSLLPAEYEEGLKGFLNDTSGEWEVRIARLSSQEMWDQLKEAYDGSHTSKGEARQKTVDHLHNEYQFITLAETDDLYYYAHESGIYRSGADRLVRECLENKLREHATQRETNEILHKLKAGKSRTADAFRGPNESVCVSNGVLDISAPASVTLRDHSSDYEFRSALPVTYDPDADCPTFRDCLTDWVPLSEDRQKLQEYVGYCLHHWGQPYHKALLLIGPTSSGKSTFLNIINELLGEENVANQSLQSLTNDRFGMAALYGKIANIYNDLDVASVRKPGIFKMLTVGDRMTAEQKYRDPFRFHATQKLLFSANQVPDVEHDDDAFYRRWLIVEFPHSISKENRNQNLESRLQQELPGILNWALDGYSRLMANEQFTADHDIEMKRSFWRSYGDSIDRFMEDRVTIVSGAKVPEKDVEAAYREFCNEHGLPKRDKQALTKELKREYNVEQTRPDIGGKRVRCYAGIMLPSEESDLTDWGIEIESP